MGVDEATKRPHVHSDHCPRGCKETVERSDLEKVMETPHTFWLGPIVAAHSIGEYTLVEYEEIDFHNGPSYGKPTGAHRFTGYINGHGISRGWRTLDEALIGIVAFKRDGINSQAGSLFIKATAPDGGTNCDPTVAKHYYALSLAEEGKQ